ncbi:MAG TPA: ISNCY family transposase [Alphaproteobacteria bacterium]|nr:ISNCY family transposase [Alphaproteobacteria bacterium]
MSVKEVQRLEVVQRVADGVMSQRQAAEALGLSERQLRRLQRGYEEAGAAALVSKKRGRPSNRQIDGVTKGAILERVRERYQGFGPTLAAEYLREDGHVVSKETLRSWMMEAGQWQGTKAKRQRPHPPRLRRPRLGELVQIDGSPHDWFEGRGPRCTLIAFIDDATSRVMAAGFVPVESTQAYLAALQAYVGTYGRPAALYSDRHGIFRKHDPEDDAPTQFQRAIAALGIEGIQALTPQAKGRVERLFQTLQDRLVKAMRLAGINDMPAANAFLPDYLERHNQRFAVPPAAGDDAHQPFDGSADTLSRICALHHLRTLSKDLVLSFNRQRYILQTGGAPRYALRGRKVTVISHADGRLDILHGEEVLPFKVFDAPTTVTSPVDDKTINARVDAIITQRWSDKSRPAPSHPWRRYPDEPASRIGQLANP